MAENSLQNQKKEVSFVLSANAKAIIEKFEEKLREGNYTAKERNGIRVELVWQLLRKQFPETVIKVEHIVENAEVIREIDEHTEIYNITTSSLRSLNALRFNVILPDLIETEELKVLYDEIPAIIDYYSYVIVDYDDLKYKFCVRLYGQIDDAEILYYIPSGTVLDILLEISKYERISGNHHFPTGKFDLVVLKKSDFILNEDTCFLKDSSFQVNGNNFELQDFIENRLNNTGTLFCEAPEIDINNDSWLSFRKWIVENKFLHGVIQLNDYSRNQILVICKQPADSIYFVDARKGFADGKYKYSEKLLTAIHEKSSDCYWELSFDEFISGNYQCYTFVSHQLSQLLCVTPKKGETVVELGNLIDLYDSEIEDGNVDCYFLNRNYYLVDDFFEPIGVVMVPEVRDVPDKEFFLFKWDTYSGRFVCAYQTGGFDIVEHYVTDWSFSEIRDSNGKPRVSTYSDAIVFKLKDTPLVPVNPYYLAKLFSSKEVVFQMDYFKQSNLLKSIVSIDKNDFRFIKVVIPPIEEQQRIVSLERQKALADTREEIKKNFELYKQDIRMKKHALAQTLRVMKGWWMNLQMARENGNGVIDDTATIGQLHPIAVKDIFENIDHEMNMLFKQVNSFNMGDTMKVDVFDAKDFIQQYVNHHDPMFEYQCELPEKAANIRFPQEAFRIILDNISSNACSHGFKGREKEKNIIRIIAEIKGQDLIIRVDNNGRPMPVEMTAEKVFTYGDTTDEGSDEHGGLGGYLIKDMMTKFGGEVELELNAEADFPVAYKLVFRDVNIYK